MKEFKTRILAVLTIICFSFISFNCSEQRDSIPELNNYTRYVDPFIGTDGTGHTFPGPSMPFGMVQPGPDNTDIGWDYTSGYQLKDSTIIGFSNTRASGTGISEFGDILLFPFVGKSREYSTTKVSEEAEVGYYRVKLANGITTELTATERVALHRYHYPGSEAKLLINLQHGLRFLTDNLVLESDIRLHDDNHTISGFCHTKNWVERKYFFTLKLSTPWTDTETLPRLAKENAPKYILSFDLPENELLCKIALSSVSVEGSEKNLAEELPHWSFEDVRRNAAEVWNSYLARVDIEADERQKRIFYTAMYHLFLQPSNIADVDGSYRGADDKIAHAKNGEYYSTLSLWDTYRAAHPLYTILAPERVNGFINTMLAHHKAYGYLPIWTAWGQENYCMIGNHSIPVIADAYLKGFEGFDAEEALQAMITTTTENHLNSNWDLYNRYGYYPIDSLDNEAVSRTLESGYDDFCIAKMAEAMEKPEIAEEYFRRAAYYQNLFDPETGLMRGKDSKGNFRTPFDPLIATSPMNNPGDYTEANAWQYTWTPAQHDVEGYIELLGGTSDFTRLLDTFFELEGAGDDKHLGQEGLIGQYAHGNEPSHHIAYLYAWSDKPERGREYITQIYNQFYDDTPQGITGNEDCGQMSAWYIFTTLGFYPVNPAGGEFILGMPQVEHARINLGNGNHFDVIRTPNGSKEFSARYNEQILNKSISYLNIMKGGRLTFR